MNNRKYNNYVFNDENMNSIINYLNTGSTPYDATDKLKANKKS